MIKFKHLLALSMTATLAANASADELKGKSNTFEITGSILPPTCVVEVEESIELGDVTVRAFEGEGTTAGEVPFTLKLVETNSQVACPTISRVAGSTGALSPSVNISAVGSVTDEGYLKNSAYTGSERESIAVQIINDKEVLDLRETQVITVAENTAQVPLKARYVALSDQIDVQKVKASFSVNVDYK